MHTVHLAACAAIVLQADSQEQARQLAQRLPQSSLRRQLGPVKVIADSQSGHIPVQAMVVRPVGLGRGQHFALLLCAVGRLDAKLVEQAPPEELARHLGPVQVAQISALAGDGQTLATSVPTAPQPAQTALAGPAQAQAENPSLGRPDQAWSDADRAAGLLTARRAMPDARPWPA